VGKKQSRRKRGRESAKWEAEHSKPPGTYRKIGFSCPRCNTDLGSPAQLDKHNADIHLGHAGRVLSAPATWVSKGDTRNRRNGFYGPPEQRADAGEGGTLIH
jgi:hypothetical protein